jgi:hypothetical protein
LAKILLAGSNPSIVDLLDNKIQNYAEGELPHASEALTALFKVLWNETTEPGIVVAAPIMPVSGELALLCFPVCAYLICSRNRLLRLIGIH